MDLILHIGVSKTGSTTIQRSLDANSGVFGDLYIPNAGDLPFIDKGHHKGVAYLANSKRLWGYKNGYLMLEYMFEECDSSLVEAVVEKNITKYREQYTAAVEKLVEKAENQGCKALLLSTELLSEVYSPDDVAEFCKLLDPIFERKQIVVYLREQVSAYVSLYAQNLKGGAKFGFDEFVKISGAKIVYDYESLIKKWEVCGWGIIPSIFYEKHHAPSGWNILDDFESLVIGHSSGVLRSATGTENNRHNVSPNADTLSLLRFFNRLGLAGKLVRFQQLVLRCAKLFFSGNKRFLGRQKREIDQILMKHAPGNASIARQFFKREKLFQ